MDIAVDGSDHEGEEEGGRQVLDRRNFDHEGEAFRLRYRMPFAVFQFMLDRLRGEIEEEILRPNNNQALDANQMMRITLRFVPFPLDLID
jgi:hypothetical protein